MSKSINIGEHLTLMLDKPVDTIVKDIQIEPTTSKIIHIDFQHLHRGEKVKVKVPIILEGTEVVAKKGGILEQILTEIEIECLPRDIPSGIKVDVSSLEVGESMHLKDLPPIKGTYITPLEATVATVLVPKAKEEKPPVEEVVPEEEEKVEEEKSKEEK
jgi:large subunit ribosomal protein L25